MATTGTVYLLHFDRPYAHARHYTGWTTDLTTRLADHAAGHGARLLAVLPNSPLLAARSHQPGELAIRLLAIRARPVLFRARIVGPRTTDRRPLRRTEPAPTVA